MKTSSLAMVHTLPARSVVRRRWQTRVWQPRAAWRHGSVPRIPGGTAVWAWQVTSRWPVPPLTGRATTGLDAPAGTEHVIATGGSTCPRRAPPCSQLPHYHVAMGDSDELSVAQVVADALKSHTTVRGGPPSRRPRERVTLAAPIHHHCRSHTLPATRVTLP